ncbi:hypothetical protein EDC01DRAFT_299327 [Geopyxis carbonaria]|nr:hypothetical protein EDC01DRAFT_299327 [Geopyxis carbonaria]
MCLIRVKPELEEEGTATSARLVAHRHNRHGSGRSTVVEPVYIPQAPVSLSPSIRETQIIQAALPERRSETTTGAVESTLDGWGRNSPGTSLVSTRSRDYYVDSASYAGRSPRNSYRYLDPRGSSQRIEQTPEYRNSGTEQPEHGARTRGDRYGYNNYHGRRSGSVSYINPRHSHQSVRSTRNGRISKEKVLMVDRYTDSDH